MSIIGEARHARCTRVQPLGRDPQDGCISLTVHFVGVQAPTNAGDAMKVLAGLVMAAALAIQLTPANSQMSAQEKQRMAAAISVDVNRALATHSKEGNTLREKVVGRLLLCGGLFKLISKQATDPRVKSSIEDIAEISSDAGAQASEGIALDRFKQIGTAAFKELNEKFGAKRTPDTEREMNILLGNCKSFHKPEERSGAVASLLLPDTRSDIAAPIQFANELQECSLYYSLWAGSLLVQVPQNSGPLSAADREKVVTSQVYMTKAEQIEVLYKRIANLAGVTEDAIKMRRDSMFEQEKRIMTRAWNIDNLHARYKDFCEYILSDTGGKARLKEITQGNVCGRLYTCW